MKVKFSSFKNLEIFEYQFDKKRFNSLNFSRDVSSFNNVELKIESFKVDDILKIKFIGLVDLTLISTYTFQEYKDRLKINDELFFTNNPEFESEEVFLVSEEIDLDQILYSLIITSIPMNHHKKGEKLPSGDGYRVITEDDLENEIKSSPFDKLIDLDFDD